MNNTMYLDELMQEIDYLEEQLGYLQLEMQKASQDENTKEYARLARLYLSMQKSYLNMCAEHSTLDEAENAADPLLSFAEGAQVQSA